MSGDFGFKCRGLKGAEFESSLLDLTIVAEGAVDLERGWTGDRINFDRKNRCFIEFRSGKERAHGIVDNYACEVSVDYVVEKYGVSREEITRLIA
ncbi:MAG: hypothetical protein REI12_05055 [Pedobacter sp.]|nr:hypothetical protein [Pedobacter sp.]